MAYKTITIKESTYKKLVKWKEKDESFSEMLDREFEQKIESLKILAECADVNAGRLPENKKKQGNSACVIAKRKT